MASTKTSQTPHLSDKILPRRGAARKADANFLEQLQSSPTEETTESDPFGEPFRSRGKGNVKVKYGSKSNSKGSSTPGPSTSKRSRTKSIMTPTAPPSLRRSIGSIGRKRPFSETDQSVSDDDVESDLTPLSSPVKSIATPIITRTTPSQTKPKMSPLNKSDITTGSASIGPLRHALTKAPRHTRSSPTLGASSKPKLMATPAFSLLRSSVPSTVENLSVASLGMFVWVLVNMDGSVVEDAEMKMNSEEKRMWWPGMVNRRKTKDEPPRILLYGSVIRGYPSLMVDIHNPSSRNLLDVRHTCFTVETFLVSSPSSRSDDSLSPKKRQKTDLEGRWQAAVTAMKASQNDKELDFDDNPIDSSPSNRAIGGRRLGDKGKERSSAGDGDGEAIAIASPEELWVPPPPDPDLDIAGQQGVLARDKRERSEYWPAQLLSYKPPQNAKQKPKYRVMFMDKKEKDLTRDMFITEVQEEEFVSCKLGTFTSTFEEVGADQDTDDEDTNKYTRKDNPNERLPSPEPIYPPPDHDDFCFLTIHEQLAYVKPILIAILNDVYAPARARHNGHIKGGTARQRVQNSAAARGIVSPDDVFELQNHILWWALREDGQGKCDINAAETETLETAQDMNVDEEAENNAQTVSTSPLSSQSGEHSRPTSPAEAPPSSFAATNTSADRERSSPGVDMSAQDLSQPVVSSTAVDESRYPRQTGCQAYEELSTVEKLGYCQNVLLPEAIIQVILWRNGNRQSVQLLSDAEEQVLHDLGETQLDVTDWVRDVLRIRESIKRRRARQDKGKGKMHPAALISPETNSGRPLRSSTRQKVSRS